MTGPMTSEFSEDVVELVVLPEPEVRSTPVPDHQLPSSVASVVRLARKLGYYLEVTYARGPWQKTGAETFTIKQTIMIRGHRRDTPHDAAFIATWVSPAGEGDPHWPDGDVKWSFNTAHLKNFTGLRSSPELREYIDPIGTRERRRKAAEKKARAE